MLLVDLLGQAAGAGFGRAGMADAVHVDVTPVHAAPLKKTQRHSSFLFQSFIQLRAVVSGAVGPAAGDTEHGVFVLPDEVINAVFTAIGTGIRNYIGSKIVVVHEPVPPSCFFT